MLQQPALLQHRSPLRPYVRAFSSAVPQVRAQAGFGKQQPKKERTSSNTKQAPAPTRPKPAPAPPGARLSFTATPEQLLSGNWNDVGVPDVGAWFDAAGREVKAITLAAGRTLVLYRYKGVVYCSDVYSTAYQFPMIDAVVEDGPDGSPTARVPLDGTVYDLLTGAVLSWCPKSPNPLQEFVANLKRASQPIPLPVHPTHVTETGALRVRL